MYERLLGRVIVVDEGPGGLEMEDGVQGSCIETTLVLEDDGADNAVGGGGLGLDDAGDWPLAAFLRL